MKTLLQILNSTKIRTVVFTFLIIIGLGFMAYFYENKVNYIHFVDEEENIVTGHYLLQGDKMYQDVFSQHQPIPAIFSAVIQRVTNPNSLFLLVKRHREFIIVWSFIWSLLLIFRFGFWTAGFVFSYELTKIFLLGNLFLAESLVVYPITYLVSLVICKPRDNPSNIELFFVGLIFMFLLFTFSPVWPLLILLFICFAVKFKIYDWKKIGLIGLGVLPVLLSILPFVRISEYINSVFVFNSKYYIPLNQNQLSLSTLPKSFFSFFLPFLQSSPDTVINQVIKVFSLCFVALSIFFLTEKKKIFFLVFLFLGLANIRFIQPGLDYYRGFHLIVWYSLLLFVVFWSIKYLAHLAKNKAFRIGLAILGTGLVVFCLIVVRLELFVKRNLLNDYYINYSGQFDLGEAVRILKSPGDTLFVAPDQMLIYWQSGIQKSSKYIFYYPFMDKVLSVQNDMAKMFENNPPTFIYCQKNLFGNLSQYLSNYLPLTRNDKPVDLYIHKDKLGNISGQQLKDLEYYQFFISPGYKIQK
ncbi:MAG: hypothetical protein ABIJ05_02890 [Patescibacteria group bacterium]